MPGIPIVELQGLRLASLTREQVAAHVMRARGEGRGGWIVTANVDHLLRHTSSAEIAALNGQADLIVADGMPLLWAARLQGTPLPGRVAGSDLVWTLADSAAAHGLSLYLLGGAPEPEVNGRGSQSCCQQFTALLGGPEADIPAALWRSAKGHVRKRCLLAIRAPRNGAWTKLPSR